MNIPLPEDIETRLTPQDAKRHLALGLFVDQRITLGQAAAISGASQSEFLQELGKHHIPVHYDEMDALADVATAVEWQAP